MTMWRSGSWWNLWEQCTQYYLSSEVGDWKHRLLAFSRKAVLCLSNSLCSLEVPVTTAANVIPVLKKAKEGKLGKSRPAGCTSFPVKIMEQILL